MLPLYIVPKRAPDEFHLIHQLSYPWGESFNAFISEKLCLVKYTSFGQAVQIVKRCGKGFEMAKCNIKSAFQLLLVHPDDLELLGFAIEGISYVDKALPMGCSILCAAFEHFNAFLNWAVWERSGLLSVVHNFNNIFVC